MALSKLVLAAVLALASAQCQVSSPDGKTTYKFESLTTSPYYSVKSKLYESYKFYFNICGAIVYPNSGSNTKCPSGTTSTCEIQTIDASDTASDQYGSTVGAAVVWNTADFPAGITDPGPTYYTTVGTCSRGAGGPVYSRVFLVCDTSATTPVAEMIDDNYWDCYVKIKLRTSAACADQAPPSGGQGGGDEEVGTDVGMILCVLFFVFGFIYLAGGVAYNMKVKHLEKFDAIPNKEFWTSLPGLVAAGFDFTKQKIQEQIDKHRGGGSSYSGLP